MSADRCSVCGRRLQGGWYTANHTITKHEQNPYGVTEPYSVVRSGAFCGSQCVVRWARSESSAIARDES